jgi:hypothetical protein
MKDNRWVEKNDCPEYSLKFSKQAAAFKNKKSLCMQDLYFAK